MGQLLPRGLNMSMRNGDNLRRAYGSFLPSSYLADPSKVFLQSDNSDRVIASGNGVFRAIFKDDMSASYSTDAVPVVDWFVPDKSPMNNGDFCTEELAVQIPPSPHLALLFVSVHLEAHRNVADPRRGRAQLQRLQVEDESVQRDYSEHGRKVRVRQLLLWFLLFSLCKNIGETLRPNPVSFFLFRFRD